MATKVYQEHPVTLFDGTVILLSPLKIKYLHQVMETFLSVKKAQNDLVIFDVGTENEQLKNYFNSKSIRLKCFDIFICYCFFAQN